MSQGELHPRALADAVAVEAGLDPRQVLGAPRGSPSSTRARRVAVWLFHHAAPGRTFTDTGRAFGRDRTTVRDAVRAIDGELMAFGGTRQAVADRALRRLGLRAG